MDQIPPFCAGKVFEDMVEAREALLDHAVDTGRAFKVTHSDSTRFLIVCMTKEKTGCPFSVRITSKERDEEAVIRRITQHTCNFTDHGKWKRANSAKLVAKRHSDLIRSDYKTKPSQIQNFDRLHFSKDTPYQQAYRGLKEVLNITYLDRKNSYQLIRPFLESITDLGLDSEAEEEDNSYYAMIRVNTTISLDAEGRFN